MAALYGRGGLADGRVRKPRRGGRGGLGGRGRTGITGAEWGRRGGLGRTGRTRADGADYAIAKGAAWPARGEWGGLGRMGRTRVDGADWGGRRGRGGGGHIGSTLEGRKGRIEITPGEPYHSWACRGDSRSAKSGCGLWGHLAPYTADLHQILRCSCRRHLLGDSHFEGAKTLYQ